MDLIKKTRDDYNRIAGHFADTRRTLWRELEQCKQYVANGQRILDWGCGNGRLLALFGPYVDIEYVGVDQSEALITIARRAQATAVRMGRAKFYCTGTRQKHFPATYFDLVFMIASFHHLPDEANRLQLLKQTYEQLKPGGRIMITVWNLDSDWANNKKKQDWAILGQQDFLIPWKDQTGKILCMRYYHAFKKDELESLLSQAGFKIELLEYSEGRWKDSKEGRNLLGIAQKI